MKKTFLIVTMVLLIASTKAQPKSDTIIVELAKTSRVVFTINDRSDLEILKHYDFNDLFKDMIAKLEKNDTTVAKNDSTEALAEVAEEQDENWNHDSDDDDDDDEDDHWDHHHRGRTSQSFNMDLGTNNWLSDGKFPDSNDELYSVRPWGSWYVGLSSIQRTRLANKFFLEWGLGINWYNFKFQDDNVLIDKTSDGTQFIPDPREELDFVKSKLTVSYVNASLIPVIDFGDYSRKSRMWDDHGNSFRIGLGPYIGYRVWSYSKLVYEEEGEKQKDKNSDNFYLNNFRYGARLQLGYRSTDLFFNYDMNELFVEGKGPSLNAFSFGIIF